MNSAHTNTKLNTQIYEEACEWLVHFRAGDADDDVTARRQLDEWLRRSPEHVRAYLEVSTVWEEVGLHDAERKIDAEAHIARALSDINVVSLDACAAKRNVVRRGPRTWAIAAAVAALGAMGFLTYTLWGAPTYTTSIGEQRFILLDDGSSVKLNARSRIQVHYSERERLVELLEGQALFKVAQDSSRPFIVSAQSTRVQAVGTQFDVSRRKSATTVTVIEGRVRVDSEPERAATGSSLSSGPDAEPPGEVFLDAGQQITVAHATRAAPQSKFVVDKLANVAAATAWTQQRLVFDSAPLSEVAEEFNRYNKRPIVIRDQAVESFGVIGVFSSTDPAALILFLRAQPEIKVLEEDSEIVITRK